MCINNEGYEIISHCTLYTVPVLVHAFCSLCINKGQDPFAIILLGIFDSYKKINLNKKSDILAMAYVVNDGIRCMFYCSSYD